ncbi:MAG TPA: hypothetical protein DCZ94_16110 [Lentisphaeria bacterium]|nr:MAG: hypothetical protein A2X48_00530 [Lentisphaerae bacterium GWF2_49_21]HBC88473.1 hypothetical protein [Lentisphaeria bacterium]
MKKTGKSKLTMREIAESEGVSHTTVSFVLRERDMGIGAATKEKILRRAISLNYHTRSDQRINLQSDRVLFLVPHYNDIYGKDSYAGRLFSQMASMEKESGFQIVLHTSMERDIIRSLYRGVCEDGASAVIPVNLSYDELENVVNLSPVPVISIYMWPGDICSRIGFDDVWIGEEAARQFFLSGHRKAAAFTTSKFLHHRSEGFRDEWKKLGGKFTNISVDSNLTPDVVSEKLTTILNRKCDFTALFCGNDNLCMGAMNAIYKCGLSVPDDISIIGCDNLGFTRYSHPPLSTFHINAETHAKQLLDGVRRLIKNHNEKIFISNKADFISRESILKL